MRATVHLRVIRFAGTGVREYHDLGFCSMTAWNVLSCGMSLVHISKNTLLDFLHEAGSPRAAQGSWVKHMEGL